MKTKLFSFSTILLIIFILIFIIFGLLGKGKGEYVECKIYKVGDLIPAKAIKVVDGDTIWIEHGNKDIEIRIL